MEGVDPPDNGRVHLNRVETGNGSLSPSKRLPHRALGPVQTGLGNPGARTLPLSGFSSACTAVSRDLLRCAKPGQARSLISVGQIVKASSSKAARTRRLTSSSVPTS